MVGNATSRLVIDADRLPTVNELARATAGRLAGDDRSAGGTARDTRGSTGRPQDRPAGGTRSHRALSSAVPSVPESPSSATSATSATSVNGLTSGAAGAASTSAIGRRSSTTATAGAAPSSKTTPL